MNKGQKRAKSLPDVIEFHIFEDVDEEILEGYNIYKFVHLLSNELNILPALDHFIILMFAITTQGRY